MRKSIKAIVITGAVALGAATTGIGWAWFSQTTNASAAGGGNATMQALAQGSATYAYDTSDNKLWPGHAATVRIPLENKNAVPVEIISVAAAGKTSSCADLVTDATSWSIVDTNGNTVGNKRVPASASYTLVINNGVSLPDTATSTCENQGFSTSWTIVGENR